MSVLRRSEETPEAIGSTKDVYNGPLAPPQQRLSLMTVHRLDPRLIVQTEQRSRVRRSLLLD